MAGYFWNRINFQDTAQTLSRDTRSRTQVASRGKPAVHGWEKARTARPESPPTAGMDGPGRMRKSLSLAASTGGFSLRRPQRPPVRRRRDEHRKTGRER